MADTPRRRQSPGRPLAFVGALGAVGIVIGLVDATVGSNAQETFITDTVSYVPAESPWLHTLMWGLYLVAIGGAIAFALWLVALLLRWSLFFLSAGLMMTAMGGLMIWLAVTMPDGIEAGHRVLFGAVAGPLLSLFGALAIRVGVARFQVARQEPR